MKYVASERIGIDSFVVREVRFLVISDRIVPHQACWVWPVVSVELKPRNTLTAVQSGGPKNRGHLSLGVHSSSGATQ
jgi:hypothetical protein